MVNKLEKGKTVPKFASQQQVKPTQHKKQEKTNVDKKIECARSVFLNARRPHIKNGIGYKSGDKHNSNVKSNGKIVHQVQQGTSATREEAKQQQ
jgi:hypothetical protein